MKTIKYNINRPWETLDPWQQEYINEINKDCWLLKGRQAGGTTAASIKVIEIARAKETKLTGKGEYQISGFTEEQGANIFLKALIYAEARYPGLIDRRPGKKPNAHHFYLKNGAHIFLQALGQTGGGARGKTPKRIWIDEAELVHKSVFVALVPSMAVSGGKMDLIGTPMGKQGYFYECSDEPELKDKIMPNFRRWRISAEDCPRHSQEELDKAKHMLTEREYAQEYLAQFLDNVSRVFSDEWISKVCVLKRTDAPLGKNYGGADLARMGGDMIAFVSIAKIENDKFRQNYLEVNRHKLTTWTEDRIKEQHKIFKFKKYGIDAGAGTLGVSIYDHLINDPKLVDVIEALNNREITSRIRGEKRKVKILKEDLYNNLVSMGERGELKLYENEEVISSLISVQWENVVEQNTMTKTRYFGKYTHTAEALIRAAWEAKHDVSLDLWAAH